MAKTTEKPEYKFPSIIGQSEAEKRGQKTCKGVTLAGKPCRSFTVMDSDYCVAHYNDGELLLKGARARVTSLNERYANYPVKGKPLWDRFFQDAKAKAFGSLEEALEARLGNGKPDHRTRLNAAIYVLDREFGRISVLNHPEMSVYTAVRQKDGTLGYGNLEEAEASARRLLSGQLDDDGKKDKPYSSSEWLVSGNDKPPVRPENWLNLTDEEKSVFIDELNMYYDRYGVPVKATSET